jgi:VIT1/CCC1 family predicted Fe2+/Mn2+ transporter
MDMKKYLPAASLGFADGTFSTFAPILVTALITQDTWTTFLIGLAVVLGAGYSMGVSYLLSHSQDGDNPTESIITGLFTVIGGMGHLLPFLIPHMPTAILLCLLSIPVELAIIAYTRIRFYNVAFWRSIFQVFILGGIAILLSYALGGH